MGERVAAGLRLFDVYRGLFHWKTFDEFLTQINQTIAYKSSDLSIVAINKPWGVGTYNVEDKNYSNKNQDRSLTRVPGRAKYCVKDILKPLTDQLQSKTPFEVLKSIDRYESGLVLLTNDLKTVQPAFHNALKSARSQKCPPYGYRALTCGIPITNNHKISELVGLELFEVDEMGDHIEPVIVQKPSLRFRSNRNSKFKSFQAELEFKKINPKLSVSLVDLNVSKLRYDFARCYLSSKVAFVLGDVRFSKRIREVFGKRIQVSAFRSSHKWEDNYEPLNEMLRKTIGVKHNSEIPMMLDLHRIRLKSIKLNKQRQDLTIESPFVPLHFQLTAKVLGLLEDDIQESDRIERLDFEKADPNSNPNPELEPSSMSQ